MERDIHELRSNQIRRGGRRIIINERERDPRRRRRAT